MTPRASHIDAFGERGWLIRFQRFDDIVSGGLFANAVADRLRNHVGVTDAVAGVDSVALRFDPRVIDPNAARKMLEDVAQESHDIKASGLGRMHDIPVCYGGASGPDFDDVCARAKLTGEQLIKVHSEPTYRIATIGFAPGFVYLGGIDERLHLPRLETPRARVEAGSIAIAGGLAGVYSLPSPGGWRIIGRTPAPLFDAGDVEPFLFKPGDKVRFRPISMDEFKSIRNDTK